MMSTRGQSCLLNMRKAKLIRKLDPDVLLVLDLTDRKRIKNTEKELAKKYLSLEKCSMFQAPKLNSQISVAVTEVPRVRNEI